MYFLTLDPKRGLNIFLLITHYIQFQRDNSGRKETIPLLFNIILTIIYRGISVSPRKYWGSSLNMVSVHTSYFLINPIDTGLT